VLADVDGTLILEGRVSTPRVAAAVADALDAGLQIGVATGRPPSGIGPLHDQLRIDGPHIVYNGAQVRAHGRPLRTWPLTAAEAVALRAVCRDRDLYAEFYVEDGFLVTRWSEQARIHWDTVTGPPAGSVDDIDLAAVEVVKATVVVFASDPVGATLDLLAPLGLSSGPTTSPVAPGLTFINVTNRAADKGKALAVAAAEAGCGVAEVVAIGDGLNDLPLFEVAGTAVAMGQSDQAVRDAAHVVVAGVADDGVAHALSAAAAWRRDAG
jgi:hypothetical protein